MGIQEFLAIHSAALEVFLRMRVEKASESHDCEKPSGNGKYVFVGCMFRSYICNDLHPRFQRSSSASAEYPDEADLVPLPITSITRTPLD